jgi:hypothetical protein
VRATDGARLKSETLKIAFQVTANRTRYVRVITNLLNLREDFNFDGYVFEEIKLINYLGTLIIGEQ